MHPQQNILQNKINTKTKARSGCLQWPLAWKRKGLLWKQ